MATLTTRLVTSIRELRTVAETWDDLWRRSAVTSPTMRASLVALHCETFAPAARVWCPMVEDQQGRPLAALPIVESRMGPITCGGFPSNEWSGSGDLLLDESADVAAVCDTLATALLHAPWPVFWFDWAPYETPRWQHFFASLKRIGADWQTRPSFQVGCVDTAGGWDQYRASWSRNHRRNMKRYEKRLEEEGPLAADLLTQLPASEVEQPLRQVFEVESRNWKAEEGTAVLQSEGIWEFYRAQALQLAEWGQLNLHYLRLGGKPIASEYGYTAKGVYHPCKIGYDGAYQKESPGNLLHMHVLEHCFRDPAIQQLDFVGPISRSTESWMTSRYKVGRVMFAPKSFLGRALLGAYRHVWPAIKRLRGIEPVEV